MAEIIRMPRLSDTMEEGVIVEWHKKVGDKVSPGDILAEVETDKATMDLENFHDGYLLHIGVKEGPVPVDGVLAVIGEKGEDYQKQLDAALQEGKNGDNKASEAGEKEVQAKAPSEAKSKPDTEAPAEPTGDVSSPNGGDDRIKASPLARAMAADAGIDLSRIEGSGEGGRIIKRDIDAYKAEGPATRPAETPSATEPRDIPVSQMRKTIARRLAESKFTAPHFYLTMEIDMTQAVADRKQINEDAEIRVSFNDLVVKACAMALKQHPAVNASWQGDKIRQYADVHIGVAVAVEEGLLVPVIRFADTKGLRAMHEEIVEMAERAQKKRLQPEEMQGNTFTVSNLGMFGIDEFTAILNPPEACILAVGAIVEKPVVSNGNITTAHIMKVTMSCDHRVVDGATGARFLQTVKQLLEHPVRMLA